MKKRLKYLSRVILTIFSISIIAGGCNNDINSSTKPSFEVEEYMIFLHSIYYSDNLSFNIVELNGLDDLSIQETTNDSIRNAMTSWIGSKVENTTGQSISIYTHSARFLSFVNSFEFNYIKYEYINDYITIDLSTGKRIMLNDLVEIDISFVKYIKENEIVKASKRMMSFDSNADDLWTYLREQDDSELLAKMEECSFTQEEINASAYATIDESIGPLVMRNSFYIRDNAIVIVLQDGGDIHLTFRFDDIKDFLKVNVQDY